MTTISNASSGYFHLFQNICFELFPMDEVTAGMERWKVNELCLYVCVVLHIPLGAS